AAASGGGLAEMLLRQPQCRRLRIHGAATYRGPDAAAATACGARLPGRRVNRPPGGATTPAAARDRVNLLPPPNVGERLHSQPREGRLCLTLDYRLPVTSFV